MKRSPSPVLISALMGVIALICLFQIVFAAWIYTTLALQAARQDGVFASAEEGMLSLVARGYLEPRDVEIIYAGPNSINGSSPYVWYVIAWVWAERRVDGSLVGNQTHDYDQPGSFFLHTKDGWIHVSEGAFPEFVGFWMKVFGLAGSGSPQPYNEGGSTPRTDCGR